MYVKNERRWPGSTNPILDTSDTNLQICRMLHLVTDVIFHINAKQLARFIDLKSCDGNYKKEYVTLRNREQ